MYQRLDRSLDNGAERRILRAYTDRYVRLGDDIPALIPQVYLHYDPYTRAYHAPGAAPLPRQRMDFLLLLPHQTRIVIECDGQQHYADESGCADSQRYADMVDQDRELRLRGYEIYRFGGAEPPRARLRTGSLPRSSTGSPTATEGSSVPRPAVPQVRPAARQAAR